MRQLWHTRVVRLVGFSFFQLGSVVLLVVAILTKAFGVHHLVSVLTVERRCLSAM